MKYVPPYPSSIKFLIILYHLEFQACTITLSLCGGDQPRASYMQAKFYQLSRHVSSLLWKLALQLIFSSSGVHYGIALQRHGSLPLSAAGLLCSFAKDEHVYTHTFYHTTCAVHPLL